MYKYYVTTTQRTHDPGKQSVSHVTFHVTCLSVSVVVFNCLMLVLLFLTYLLSSGTTVIGSTLLWHPCLLFHCCLLFQCSSKGEASRIKIK